MLERVDEISGEQRRWLFLVVDDLATTPTIFTRDDYQHYLKQLAGMKERFEDESPTRAMTMAYALYLRLLEYEHVTANQRASPDN